MKTKPILPSAAILFLSLCAFAAFACAQKRQVKTQPPPPQQTGPFLLEGKSPTGYKSICDLKPEPAPKTAALGVGMKLSFSAGCQDFDNQPVAPLFLRVRNQSADKQTFKIPLLSEVTVDADKGSQPAVAFYIPWGPMVGFANVMEGSIEVDVSPGETVELIYLVPRTAGKPFIHIRDLVIELKV